MSNRNSLEDAKRRRTVSRHKMSSFGHPSAAPTSSRLWSRRRLPLAPPSSTMLTKTTSAMTLCSYMRLLVSIFLLYAIMCVLVSCITFFISSILGLIFCKKERQVPRGCSDKASHVPHGPSLALGICEDYPFV